MARNNNQSSNSRNGNNQSNGGRNGNGNSNRNGNGNGNNRNGNGNNRNGSKQQNQRPSQPQTKAIMRMKRSKKNEHTIKATFTDSAGNEVKELIQTYSDGDPKDLLIEAEKQMVKLGSRYNLFNNGEWEQLIQTFGRALDGRIEEIWSEKADDIRNQIG